MLGPDIDIRTNNIIPKLNLDKHPPEPSVINDDFDGGWQVVPGVPTTYVDPNTGIRFNRYDMSAF